MPVVQMLHMERVRKLDGFKQQAECMRQAIELVEQGMTDMNLQVLVCSVLSRCWKPCHGRKLREAKTCLPTQGVHLPAWPLQSDPQHHTIL